MSNKPVANLQFLGAAETVTGSKYLLTVDGVRILIDCGLYQGTKNLRLRNWQPLFKGEKIDAVVLTHAHIDHSGYIPLLVKNGFRGPIYCTPATLALCEILLPDAGYLQEEDARYMNKHHISKHHPALPLFTEEDARQSLQYFEPVSYGIRIKLPVASEEAAIELQFSAVGHILGASYINITVKGKQIVFSGDVGRPKDSVMYAPAPIKEADYLIVESTYGDRRHPALDPMEALREVVGRTIKRGGIVLIPAFAVGRVQAVLYFLHQLIVAKQIPPVPIYLNSPMALAATEVFNNFASEHRLTRKDCEYIEHNTHFIRSVDESKALNRQNFPCVIISSSGMASGGRVIHHLKTLIGNHRNSVVFVGFQAPGTRGDSLVRGAESIKMHGDYYPVNAEVVSIEGMSAHADYQEIIDWVKTLKKPPQQTFVTHGEKAAADSMRRHLTDQLGWNVSVPEYRDSVDLY